MKLAKTILGATALFVASSTLLSAAPVSITFNDGRTKSESTTVPVTINGTEQSITFNSKGGGQAMVTVEIDPDQSNLTVVVDGKNCPVIPTKKLLKTLQSATYDYLGEECLKGDEPVYVR